MEEESPEIDQVQIARWKTFGPRLAPKNYSVAEKKQRQALLQWAYNPFF